MKTLTIHFYLVVIHLIYTSIVLGQPNLVFTSFQKFGDGYNSVTNEFSSKEVVESRVIEDINIGNTRSYKLEASTYSSSNEKYELNKYLASLSVSAEFGIGGGSASWSSSSTNIVQINNFSNYLVIELNVSTGTKRMSEPFVKKEYLKKIGTQKSKIRFLNQFGDEFVRFCNYGSKLIVVYENMNSTHDEFNNSRENLSIAANYLNGKIDASYTSEKINQVKKTLSQINVKVIGIGVDAKNKLPDFFDPISLQQYTQEFINSNQNALNVVSVGTLPINGLIDSKKKLLPDELMKSQKNYIDSIYMVYNHNMVNLNSALYYRNNFDLSELKFDIVDVNAALLFSKKLNINKNGFFQANFIDNTNDSLNKLDQNIDRLYELNKYINKIQKANYFLDSLLGRINLDVSFRPKSYVNNYYAPSFNPKFKNIPINVNKRIELRVDHYGGWQTRGYYKNGVFDKGSIIQYVNTTSRNLNVSISKSAFDYKRNFELGKDALANINVNVVRTRNGVDENLSIFDEITLMPGDALSVNLDLIKLFGQKGDTWNAGNWTRIFPHYIQNVTEWFDFGIYVNTNIYSNN